MRGSIANPGQLILGIDASNIRGGGGLTHLRETLCAARPEQAGISRIVIWGRRATIELLPKRDWLESVAVRDLDGNLFQRLVWQHRHLDAVAAASRCGVLLVPGGSYLGRFKPFVAVCQNLLPFCPAERARFGFSRARVRYHLLEGVQTRTFRRAVGVIFLTESARQIVLQRTGACISHSRIIPHGIHERFRAAPRLQTPISEYSPEKPFRWLYVSMINWYKHQDTVAEAVAILRSRGLPVTAAFIGPAYPPALTEFKRVLRRHDPLGAFLRYRGPVRFSELDAAYLGADGFIFASSCENLPNILLEAMAAGLPIAASRVSPMPEILGDAGEYFDPESPSELAEALARLLNQPQLRTVLARRAFERSRQFSWRQCAQATLDFIAQAAATKANPVASPKHATNPARPRFWRNAPG